MTNRLIAFKKKVRALFQVPSLIKLFYLEPNSPAVLITAKELSSVRLASNSFYRVESELRLPYLAAGHHLTTCHTPNNF